MPEVAERSTVEILKAARERITPYEKWCTGCFAKNLDDVKVPVGSAQACKWCASGALLTEVDPSAISYYSALAKSKAWEFLKSAAGDHLGPEDVNDWDGHAAVLDMFDRAIHLAEQEAASA